MSRRLLAITLCAFSILALPFPSSGASFRTFPTRLVLGPDDKAQTLKIVNEGSEKVTVQVTAFEWRQDEKGEDQLLPTKDLVYYPRSFEFGGKEEQTIKAGYEKKRGETERTFRLIIEEIPSEAVGKDTGVLRMVLRMSVPVFVKPGGAASKTTPDITEARIERGKLSVKIRNAGKEHLFVKSIAAEGKDSLGKNVLSGAGKGWYVLAESSRVFEVGVPGGMCGAIKTLGLEVATEGEPLRKTFGIDDVPCVD